MLSSHDLNRICATTLSGRFGVYVQLADGQDHSEYRQETAGGLTHPRNAAVRSTARRGIEQGNLKR